MIIFDEPSQDNSLQSILSFDLGKALKFAACVGSEDVALYQVSMKSKSQASSDTVKRCDCRVSLGAHSGANAQNIQG